MTVGDDSLPPLKDIIKQFSLSAKKSLGQNFLLDMNITRKIARHAGAAPDTHFLEVGPGPGGLTRALLMEHVKHITVIEKDERCLDILDQIAQAYPNKVKIIHGDALKLPLNDIMSAGQPFRIAANLPYNISSEILIKWLREAHQSPWLSATLMFQKEFAMRLQAKEGSKDYGRLSVLCGVLADVKRLFDLNPAHFTPPPKVTSSVVQIIPKKNPVKCDISVLEKVTQACFGQRRKMLRQSLKQLNSTPEELCKLANISPEARADHITVQDYVTLTNLLASST
ncbi:MAG: 16S rRNA (adenine(1518)-N(6)/adenine(1519)-N(6))-dimethyltransferase RsmA [Pseudomonadota bacterium]